MKINVKGYEFEIDDKFLQEYEDTMREHLADNIEFYIRTTFRQSDLNEVFATVPFYKIYNEVIFAAFEEIQMYRGEI